MVDLRWDMARCNDWSLVERPEGAGETLEEKVLVVLGVSVMVALLEDLGGSGRGL
jgi:hypothetical protein